ncbi:phage portal protein [Cryobacterium luteum]|nr:phage portal protein [Cryobacterium luteum]SEM73501.1 Phage portal protein BeeE [Cryobacterium luteum]
MGILDRLGVGKRASDFLASSIDLGVTSPWASGEHSLTQVVLSDIYGAELIDSLPLSRAEAITIPAVSKARNLLVSTIAKFPLRALDTAGLVAVQPSWMFRTNGNVTPYERMVWTVDDGIFYGYALWLVERGAPDSSGRRPILHAAYCPMSDWKIVDGGILVHDQPVDAADVIFFNFPFEGLLNIANRTLKGARDQEAAWVGRARNPIPLIELHQTDDAMDTTEIPAFVDAWSLARRSENGAIGYTPSGLEIRTHGEVSADLMVEGRNAVRTDVGSFLNVRASMLDGTAGVDSLTYSTTQGEKNSFYEFDLPFWTDPIEARLSMDDVLPRGQRSRFDKYEAYNLPTATGPIQED